MMKQEFDKASREAGFGPCADYMWPEIERCYSASDRISQELIVDIYWHEPGIYRTILAKRQEVEEMVCRLKSKVDGYRFAEIETSVKAINASLHEMDYAIDSAIYRKMKREGAKK